MEQKELINFFIKEIENLGYDIQFIPMSNKVIINTHTLQCAINPSLVTPFSLAHDLQHALNKDDCRLRQCDTVSQHEAKANIGAILTLWELWLDNDGDYEHFDLFCDVTGCPYEQSWIVVKSKYDEYYNTAI